MNQQTNRINRILIVVAVWVVVAIASYFFLIQGKLNQVAQSKAQLADLQTKYADLKRVADQKPQYLSLIKQVQSRLTGVELTADPRAYIPSYLKQIEDLAKRDGLVVTAVLPQPLPTPSGSPAAAPAPTGASGVQNIPVIGQPLKQAGRALNASNTQTAETNNVAAQTGATPIPGSSPIPVPSGGVAPNAAQIVKTNPTSARANAIVYLNQSFSNVPVNMELSGTYSDLQKFLRDLNKFPKLIGVGNVTVQSQQKVVGETPKLHITLPITAYRLSPNGPAPAATAAPAGNGG